MADLDREIQRGHEAERLMADPMLRDALQTMLSAVETQLLRADVNNGDHLKTLVMQYQAVNSFKKLLKTTMETGKLAHIQKETLAQRLLKKVKG